MISYGYSIQGKLHIKKNKVCQDSNIICELKKGWILAAVADGVGSAAYSDIGSKIATEKIAQYCRENFPAKPTEDNLEDILREGYRYALNSIIKYSENSGGNIRDYDTTLSAVLYDGNNVIFGHSGDGGIIVRKSSGEFMAVTDRQKGVDGISVIPLRGGEGSWSFGICREQVTAVLLVTDGILDGVLMPYLLNIQGASTLEDILDGKKEKVYITAAEFFMNPKCVFENKKIKNPEEFVKTLVEGTDDFLDRNKVVDCIRNGYAAYFGKKSSEKIVETVDKYGFMQWAMQKVSDDKTVVCLINDKAKVKVALSTDYYMEPDWKGLQHTYNMIMYPDMHNGEVDKRGVKENSIDAKKELHYSDAEQKNTKKDNKIVLNKNIKGKLRKCKRKLLVLFFILGGVLVCLGVFLDDKLTNEGLKKDEEVTTNIEMETQSTIKEEDAEESITTTEEAEETITKESETETQTETKTETDAESVSETETRSENLSTFDEMETDTGQIDSEKT